MRTIGHCYECFVISPKGTQLAFDVEEGLPFKKGDTIKIKGNERNYMEATVNFYEPTNTPIMAIVTKSVGEGQFCVWRVTKLPKQETKQSLWDKIIAFFK